MTLGKSMLAQAEMLVVFVLNETISSGTSSEVTAKRPALTVGSILKSATVTNHIAIYG